MGRRFERVFNGFSASLTPAALKSLRENPDVVQIEPDIRSSLQMVRPSTSQYSPPWGLDRIDQRDRPLSGAYSFDATGFGVTAYVLDSGIYADHQEFGGRVMYGYDAVGYGLGTTDCNGHGTHVAGTIGGATYGVAKRVTLRPVRVLDCSGGGYLSEFLAGVDWVIGDHLYGEPAVANMSTGFGTTSYFADDAVNRLVLDGVTVIVAAGNSAGFACNYSPADALYAYTVAAVDSSDSVPWWSNEGACVSTFAPGVGIQSAWPTSSTATTTLEGTSMAAPHVAGVAALVLQAHPTYSPSSVWSALNSAATTGRIQNEMYSSPDSLVYSKSFAAADPVGPANDNFSSATTIPSGGGTLYGSTSNASPERGEPLHDGTRSMHTAWWTFTPAFSGTTTISTAGSSFDTLLAVYTGSSVTSLSSVASNDDYSGLTSQVSFYASAGVPYRIAVAGFDLASGSVTVQVTPPVAPTYQLSVSLSGTGSGTVSSSVGGLTCPSTCSTAVVAGTTVALYASPAPESRFVGWSGDGCSGSTTCTVTMTSARSVTATFQAVTTLSVIRSGSGAGYVTSDVGGISCGATCSASIPTSTTVVLSATATYGSVFTGWSGAGCSGTSTCSVTMDEASSVTATFEAAYVLSVVRSGSGTGRISSEVGGIDCGLTCSTSQLSGTIVLLTATPDATSRFVGWGGGCVGTAPCSLTLTGARTVVARFAKLPVAHEGPGSASIDWGLDAWPEIPAASGFVVEKSTDGVVWSPVATTRRTVHKQIAKSLTNGTSYRFRVTARSSSATGAWIETDWIIPRAPASAPRSLTVTPRNGHVVVQWLPPATDGASAISDYRLQRSTNGRTWVTVLRDVSTVTSYDVTGLRNGSRYYFRVAAVNGIGIGANAKSKAVKPSLSRPAAPTVPAAEPGLNTVRLFWAAPTKDGGSEIVDYRVQYSTNGRTWTTYPHDVSTATELTLKGLRGGQSYRFRVAAINVAGVGSNSSARAAVPLTPNNFGSGRVVVGTDLEPGRYVAYSAANCSWTRWVGASLPEAVAGGAGSVLVGPVIVDILPGDLAFDSTGCGGWYLLVNLAPLDRVGNGDWAVGEQMTPGQWTSNSVGTCTWSRQKGWSGVLEDVLQSGSGSGVINVVIGDADAGFSSAGCGLWTRLLSP